MSEAVNSPTKAKGGWTEIEKIIEKSGKIPWSEIEVPEGRTLKAVQVMVDKEKAKIRKSKGDSIEDGKEGTSLENGGPKQKISSANKGKKRTADSVNNENGADDAEKRPWEKAKAPRKKIVQPKVETEEEDTEQEE